MFEKRKCIHNHTIGRLSEDEDEANVVKERSRSPNFSNENVTPIVGRQESSERRQ